MPKNLPSLFHPPPVIIHACWWLLLRTPAKHSSSPGLEKAAFCLADTTSSGDGLEKSKASICWLNVVWRWGSLWPPSKAWCWGDRISKTLVTCRLLVPQRTEASCEHVVASSCSFIGQSKTSITILCSFAWNSSVRPSMVVDDFESLGCTNVFSLLGMTADIKFRLGLSGGWLWAVGFPILALDSEPKKFVAIRLSEEPPPLLPVWTELRLSLPRLDSELVADFVFKFIGEVNFSPPSGPECLLDSWASCDDGFDTVAARLILVADGDGSFSFSPGFARFNAVLAEACSDKPNAISYLVFCQQRRNIKKKENEAKCYNYHKTFGNGKNKTISLHHYWYVLIKYCGEAVRRKVCGWSR